MRWVEYPQTKAQPRQMASTNSVSTLLASDASPATNTASVQANAAAGSHGRARNESLTWSRNVRIINALRPRGCFILVEDQRTSAWSASAADSGTSKGETLVLLR